ncbi:hypothetical protein ANN_26487 [Periplaneta americana]|uniref:Uncharacterized protein n=1 Tax=Periplaneta americana TaxID=6978 RepID=A0ABQ8RYA2_PERAM|nr:hypothetical protein ANN_26487 [Periplaneta americana]
MAKEAFNRKRSIFSGPLEKELRKGLVKCFVWSVALNGAETWTLRRNEEKRLEAFEMWIWRRMECVKSTDRIRNEAVLERVGEERMMLKLIRKRKRNCLDQFLRRNCLLKYELEGMTSALPTIVHSSPRAYFDLSSEQIHSLKDRVNDAIDKLNEDIDSILTWTKKIHLKTNPGKTQAIILGQKRQTDAVKHLDISPLNPAKTLELATGVAQSVKALACRSEVALERGFDPRLG